MAAEYPNSPYTPNPQSTANDVPGDPTIANGADYNKHDEEIAAITQDLRAASASVGQTTIEDSFTVLKIADGTAANNTLRWDGAAWVESNVIRNTGLTGNGDLTAVIGEDSGDQQRVEIYAQSGASQGAGLRLIQDASAGRYLSLYVKDAASFIGHNDNFTTSDFNFRLSASDIRIPDGKVLDVQDTTPSTSSTTGAVVVTGGIGVGDLSFFDPTGTGSQQSYTVSAGFRGQVTIESEGTDESTLVLKNNSTAGGVPLAFGGHSEGYTSGTLNTGNGRVDTGLLTWHCRSSDASIDIGPGTRRTSPWSRSFGQDAGTAIGLDADANGAVASDTILKVVREGNSTTTHTGQLFTVGNWDGAALTNYLTVENDGEVRFDATDTGSLTFNGDGLVFRPDGTGDSFVVTRSSHTITSIQSGNRAGWDFARSAATASIYVTNVGTDGLYLESSSDIYAEDPFRVTDSTGSTSTTTGALVVSGGAGVAENVWIGEELEVGYRTNLRADTSTRRPMSIESSESNGQPLTWYGRREGYVWYVDFVDSTSGDVQPGDVPFLNVNTTAVGDTYVGIGNNNTVPSNYKPEAANYGALGNDAYFSVTYEVGRQQDAAATTMRVSGDSTNNQTGNIFEVGDETETFFAIGPDGLQTQSTQSPTVSGTITAARTKFTGTTAGQTLTLPAGVEGLELKVRNSGTFSVDIASAGVDTIEGATTFALAPGESITITFIGSDWTVF